jgi:hypothetical protein
MDTAMPRLRALGVVDQLDLALRLYRRNFTTYLGVAVLLQAPLLLIETVYEALVLAPLQEQMTRFTPAQPSPFQGDFLFNYLGAFGGLMLISIVLGIPAWVLTSAALTRAVSESYLGHPIGVLNVFSSVLSPRRLASLLAASLLIALASLIAIIPCLGWVAAIYLGLRWAVTPQVIVVEDLGPMAGLSRAWSLAEGHLQRLMALGALGYGAYFILSTAIGGVLGLGTNYAVLVLHLPLSAIYVAQNAVSGVLSVFAQPFLFSLLTVFYYDLRVRKEGYDLSVLADQLLTSGTPA